MTADDRLELAVRELVAALREELRPPRPTQSISTEWWELSDWRMSMRVGNALARNRITPAMAQRMTDADLRRYRMIGPKAIGEIRRALETGQ